MFKVQSYRQILNLRTILNLVFSEMTASITNLRITERSEGFLKFGT